MTEFTAELAPKVLASCQENALSISEALSCGLDAQISVESAAAFDITSAVPTPDLQGPGLVVVLKFGEVGVALCIPQSTRLLPIWYSAPDANGEIKLAVLAQELSLLIAPESLAADEFHAAKVDDLEAALARGCLAENAAQVRLHLVSRESTGTASLVWPLASPDSVLPPKPVAVPGAPVPRAVPTGPSRAPLAQTGSEPEFDSLPAYSRSLLRVRVPVRVNLASKKEPIRSIVELGAGSIIRFNKSCEETLELEVGGQRIARGEAVKVGDKFGLRITSMILPDEQFKKLEPAQ